MDIVGAKVVFLVNVRKAFNFYITGIHLCNLITFVYFLYYNIETVSMPMKSKRWCKKAHTLEKIITRFQMPKQGKNLPQYNNHIWKTCYPPCPSFLSPVCSEHAQVLSSPCTLPSLNSIAFCTTKLLSA